MYESVFEELNKRNKIDKVPPLLNEILFFPICFRDIIQSLCQFKAADDPAEKNLQCRELAMHLFELLDDSKAMLGKQVRKMLLYFPDKDFLTSELNQVKHFHKTILDLTSPVLADIRHNASAHKSQQSLVLNRYIKKMDQDQIESFALLVLLFAVLVFTFQENALLSLHLSADKTLTAEEIEQMYRDRRTISGESRKMILKLIGIANKLADVMIKLGPGLSDMLQKAKDIMDDHSIPAGDRLQTVCHFLPSELMFVLHDWNPVQVRYLKKVYKIVGKRPAEVM
jgi:hypothetical protein